MATTAKVKRRRKVKTPGSVRINLDGCKYDVLRRVAASLQWTIVGEDQAPPVVVRLLCDIRESPEARDWPGEQLGN